MEGWRLLCILCVAVCSIGAQELTGSVEDVTTFSSCTNVAGLNDTNALDPHALNNLTETESRTPCDLVGTEQNVTAVRVRLNANAVASQDTLVFNFNSLPDNPDAFDGDPDTVCTGTIPGRDCQVLTNPVAIGFDTSSVAAMYPLLYDPLYMPYGYTWSQCKHITIPQSVVDDVSASNQRHAFVQAIEGNCMEWAASVTNQFIDDDATTSLCSLSNVQNLQDGSSACPMSADDEDTLTLAGKRYYTPPPDGAQDARCPAVFCPIADENAYQTGIFREIYPTCRRLRITNPPRAVMNVIARAARLGANGTAVPFSELFLSTLQDGAAQVDTTRAILGRILTFNSGTGAVASSLQGSLVTCGTCDPDNTDSVCKDGLLSDVRVDDLSDPRTQNSLNPAQAAAAFGVTENPWIANLARLTADDAFCTVPTEVCRNRLLGAENSGSWMYYNPERSNQWFGNRCNGLELTSEQVVADPSIGTMMCLGGMRGTCVPGYEQFAPFTRGERALTPCEIQTQFANLLGRAETDPASVNFGVGMPPDFNFVAPQYWMDGYSLYRDAISPSGTNVFVEAELYLTAEYIGEVQSFAPGEIVESQLVCSSPSGSPGGELVVQVRNTGQSSGEYEVVVADVTNPSGAPATDVSFTETSQLISLLPGQTGVVVLTYNYAGTNQDAVSMRVNLTIPAVQAFSTAPRVLQSISVDCTSTASNYEFGVFGGAAVTLLTANTTFDADDDDAHCNIWDITCWDGNVVFVIFKVIFFGFVAAILIFAILYCVRVTELSKLQKQRIAQATSTGESIGISPPEQSAARAGLRRRTRPSFAVLGLLCVALVAGCNARPDEMYVPLHPVPFVLIVAVAFLFGVTCILLVQHPPKSRRIKPLFMALCGTAFVAVCSAQIDVLGINSFTQCIESNDFSCDSGRTTTIDLRVESTEDTSGGGTFVFDVSVVPLTSDETQFGSGQECQTDQEGPCQITVPTTVRFDVGRPALQYQLIDEPNFFVPYTYFANVVGDFSLSSEQQTEACGDCDCTLGASYHVTQPQQSNHIINDTVDLFSSPNANFDHYRCPYTTIDSTDPLPDGLPFPMKETSSGATESIMNYRWVCTCSDSTSCAQAMSTPIDDDDNEMKAFAPTISLEFWQQRPMCRVYGIQNPSDVVATVAIEITAQTPQGVVTDRVQVQSVQQNMHGTTAFSELGFFQLKILNPLTPDGRVGPNIPGYIVVCTEDAEFPGRLSMQPVPEDEAPTNPFQNPWSTLTDNAARFPTPPDLSSLLETPDTHATFYYINTTEAVNVGRCCGCLGVDPDLYAHPPVTLDGNQLRTTPPVTFKYRDLVGASQGGTGGLQNFLTCIPNFGLSRRDIDPTTPCEAINDFLGAQDTIRTLLNDDRVGEARSVRVPHLPLPWDNLHPNFWITEESKYLLYEPGDRNRIAFETQLITSADFVQYVADPKPNGFISQDTRTTFCVVDIETNQSIDGFASYKMCNSELSPSDASFFMDIECGMQTTDTPPFTLTTRLGSTPASTQSNTLAPGECAETGSADGPSPFVILDNPSLQDSFTAENSNVICIYRMTMSPAVTGFVASDVIVDTFTVGCSFSANGTVPVPPSVVIDGTYDPEGPELIDVRNEPADPDDSDDGLPIFNIIIIGAASIAGLVFLGLLVYVCCIGNRDTEVEKELSSQLPERSGRVAGAFDEASRTASSNISMATQLL